MRTRLTPWYLVTLALASAALCGTQGSTAPRMDPRPLVWDGLALQVRVRDGEVKQIVPPEWWVRCVAFRDADPSEIRYRFNQQHQPRNWRSSTSGPEITHRRSWFAPGLRLRAVGDRLRIRLGSRRLEVPLEPSLLPGMMNYVRGIANHEYLTLVSYEHKGVPLRITTYSRKSATRCWTAVALDREPPLQGHPMGYCEPQLQGDLLVVFGILSRDTYVLAYHLAAGRSYGVLRLPFARIP